MATAIEFDPHVARLNKEAISMAKADSPDFDGAREALQEGLAILGQHKRSPHVDTQMGRLLCDYGVTHVREGLYVAEQAGNLRESLRYFPNAFVLYSESLQLTGKLLAARGVSPENEYLLPAIHSHNGATLGVRARTVGSQQVARGVLSKERKATPELIEEQRDFGRNGAGAHFGHGEPGYFPVSNAFNGMRMERANGGFEHSLKAAKWLLRGEWELARTVLNRQEELSQAGKTAARLILESLMRNGALKAMVHYQTF